MSPDRPSAHWLKADGRFLCVRNWTSHGLLTRSYRSAGSTVSSSETPIPVTGVVGKPCRVPYNGPGRAVGLWHARVAPANSYFGSPWKSCTSAG